MIASGLTIGRQGRFRLNGCSHCVAASDRCEGTGSNGSMGSYQRADLSCRKESEPSSIEADRRYRRERKIPDRDERPLPSLSCDSAALGPKREPTTLISGPALLDRK